MNQKLERSESRQSMTWAELLAYLRRPGSLISNA